MEGRGKEWHVAIRTKLLSPFAGDSDDLERAFKSVGSAADDMQDEVGDASKRMRKSGEGFDRMAEKTDRIDTSAMGFRDTITGVQDTMKGLQDESLSTGEKMLTLGMGVGDLASGFTNFLIPQMKSAVTWLGNTTIAQRALNVAMRLNPIGVVITLLIALAAGFTLAWKRSETFRKIVKGAWEGIKTAASNTWDFLKGLLSWIMNLPGAVGRAFADVASAWSAPFTTAFGAIKRLWNSTVGGFGFDIPGWVPKVGGNSFRIPNMHRGGIIPGAPGQEQLMVMQSGERVTSAVGSSSAGRTVIELRSGGSALDDALVEILARSIRNRGGDVQLVLGAA